MKTFSVEYPGVEEVKPYFRNSKIHTNKQIREVAQSIKTFGFDQPIVVDSGMVIIKGHGRYFAALSIGLKNVPVIVRDDLSAAQIKASRIADNRIFEMTPIDLEVHSQELDDLAAELEADTSSQDFIEDSADTYFDDVVDENYTPAEIDSSYEEPPPHDDDDEPVEEEEFEAVEEAAPVLDGGRLMVCPKCINSFYVQKG